MIRSAIRNSTNMLFLVAPYLVTFLVMIGASNRAEVPAALATPYRRGRKE